MTRLSRDAYHARYGPTTDDRVRLGDTDLWLRVERDAHDPGDEPLWGYAKNVRSRMGQADAAAGPSELDVVIAGVVVVDPTIGVVKADIGIKDGRIVGIGRAGNPDISDDIDLPIGPHTDPVMGYGLIATPGIVDSHVHLITPALLPAALSAGIDHVDHGRVRGATPTDAPTARGVRGLAAQRRPPGGRPDRRRPAASTPLLEAGAVGFKIHEDYGAYPELIDRTLAAAEAARRRGVAPHRRAARGRRARGHGRGDRRTDRPRLPRRGHRWRTRAGPHRARARGLTSCARRRRRPCRTGRRTAAEHVAMTLLNHGGNPWACRPTSRSSASGSTRPTMAAEGPLHELGAIAHRQLRLAGHGPDRRDGPPDVPAGPRHEGVAQPPKPAPMAGPGRRRTTRDDTARVLRYLAKVHDRARDHPRPRRPRRLAPAGPAGRHRPVEAGLLRRQARGGAQGRLARLGPAGRGQRQRSSARSRRATVADWAGHGLAPADVGVTFVSAAAPGRGLAGRLGTRRRLVAVHGCRGLTRASLWSNRATTPIDVDPDDGTVTLGGRTLAVAPVAEVPLSRRYLLALTVSSDPG